MGRRTLRSRDHRRSGDRAALLMATGLVLLLSVPASGKSATLSGTISPSSSIPGAAVPSPSGCLPAACPSPMLAPGPAAAPRSAERPAASPVPGESFLSNWSAGGVVGPDPLNPAHWIAAGASVSTLSVGNGSSFNDSGLVVLGDSLDAGANWSLHTELAGAGWSDPSSPYCGLRHSYPGAAVVRVDGVGVIADVAAPYHVPGLSCSAPSAASVVYVVLDHGPNASEDVPFAASSPSEGSASYPRLAIAADSVFLSYDLPNGTAVVRRSVDGGVSWGSPAFLPGSGAGVVALAALPNGTLAALYTVPGPLSTLSIVFSQSSDGGATFTAGRVVGTTVPLGSVSPTALYPLGTEAQLAIDLNSSSPYYGRLYAGWSNGSGAAPGSPTIDLRWSEDGGRTWSASPTVDPGSGHEDIDPAMAVEPDGVLVLEWYGIDPGSGVYRLYGSASHDGGVTFSPTFSISRVDSRPPSVSGGTREFLGDASALRAGPGGLVSVWTDSRSSLAVNRSYWGGIVEGGQFLNSSLWTAGLVPVTMSSNVPATIAVSGSLDEGPSVPLTSVPTAVLAATGSPLTIQAPPTVPNGSATLYFSSWFGTAYSTNDTLLLIPRGAVDVVSCYEPIPNAVCRAAGAPGFLHVNGTPSNALVLLDGHPFLGPSSSFFLPVSPGQHIVTATLIGHVPFQSIFTLLPGDFGNVSFALPTLPAPIVGTVTPATADLRVDGVPVAVDAAGAFAVNVSQGNHTVLLSAYGYLPFLAGPTFVAWDRGWFLSVHLTPLLAEISGSVSPSNASLSLNGVSEPVRPDGTFALGVPVGIYWLNASAKLYDSRSYGPLSALPLGTYFVNLTLPRLNGTLSVAVSPMSALVRVDGGSPTALPGGHDLLTLPWGSHTLLASAAGFDPRSATVDVPYNASASVTLNLTVASGWVDAILDPGAAALRVDGSPVPPGVNGTFNLSIPSGVHELTAAADGFLTASTAVIVSPGRATIVWLNLSSASPANLPLTVGRLLPGLGLALVVVGAVAVVFALSSRRPAAPPARPLG